MDGKFVKVTIVESVIGLFGFSEDNTVVEKVFFPKDPLKTAEMLKNIEDGELIDDCQKCGCPDDQECLEDGSCKLITVIGKNTKNIEKYSNKEVFLISDKNSIVLSRS